MPKQLDPMYVTYNDVNYAIYPFDAMTAVEMSGDLAKFLGPIVSALLPLFTGGVSGETVDDIGASATKNVLAMSNDQLIPMLQGALTSLDGRAMRSLMNRLLISNENIVCEIIDDNGKAVQRKLTAGIMNELFIGNLDVMLRLAVDVVRLNYAGFFKNLLSQSGSQQEPLKARRSKNTESLMEVVSLL
jgi:hypothetical protein